MQQDVKEVRFRLNFNNPKDVIIGEFLSGEYNHNEFVKALLYKLATGGKIGHWVSTNVNLGESRDTKSVTEGLQEDYNVPLDDVSGQFRESEGISEQATEEFADYFK